MLERQKLTCPMRGSDKFCRILWNARHKENKILGKQNLLFYSIYNKKSNNIYSHTHSVNLVNDYKLKLQAARAGSRPVGSTRGRATCAHNLQLSGHRRHRARPTREYRTTRVADAHGFIRDTTTTLAVHHDKFNKNHVTPLRTCTTDYVACTTCTQRGQSLISNHIHNNMDERCRPL